VTVNAICFLLTSAIVFTTILELLKHGSYRLHHRRHCRVAYSLQTSTPKVHDEETTYMPQSHDTRKSRKEQAKILNGNSLSRIF
jgi:hypothetical protein